MLFSGVVLIMTYILKSAETTDNFIKNGNFKMDPDPSIGYKYECPREWESSSVLNSHGGPVLSRDGGIWAPSPIPSCSTSYLVLQPYNHREMCFVEQHLKLKKGVKYSLSFYGASRPGYPKGTLVITTDTTKIFEKELPDTWTKYTLDFKTICNATPILSLINNGVDNTYATAIACIELKEIVSEYDEIDDEELERQLLDIRKRRKNKLYKEVLEIKQSAIEKLREMLQQAELDLEEFKTIKGLNDKDKF
jgi:hypothetical protein